MKIITYTKNGMRKEVIENITKVEAEKIWNEEISNKFPAPTIWDNDNNRIAGY